MSLDGFTNRLKSGEGVKVAFRGQGRLGWEQLANVIGCEIIF